MVAFGAGTILGVGAPPILVNFSGDWDAYWGYGFLTHSHVLRCQGNACYTVVTGKARFPITDLALSRNHGVGVGGVCRFAAC